MNFRRTRPKSRYQDKIFNRYWESNATEPKTIFDKNKKKINKLNIETEKETKEIEKLPKSLNTEITPLDKIMQGDRKLYKFPHINWENKNPNRFLNHVGGINFEFSKTTTMDSSRPSGLNLIINDNNMSNSRMNQNNSRPITAMNNINNNKNRFNRPTTAINKALIRPKTASNYGMVKNNALIKVPQLNMTDSSTNNINPTNISRNMKDIPLSVQTKLEKEIKEKYEYKDQFFNSEEEDKGEEKEYLVDTEILDDFDDNKYATLKSKYEEEKNKPVKYPKVESLMNRFGKMNLQNYSIKTSQADKDLLDIFDRAQKTHASTLGKVGNYEYYSTYQRIGSFMDFSQHLKIEALQKIGRDIYQNRKNLLEFQSKHNIQKPVFGELLINTCPHFRDSNSLFHGFMPFEEEGQKIMKQYNKSVDIYDPLDFLPKYVWEELFKEEKYSPDFIKSVVTSINNYKKYLDSEKFLMSDLKRFSKSLFKKKIIKKIDITIYLDNNYKRLINENVNESERLYYDTLKRGIMNYILRSPFERKRLNILFYPNKTLPASYTIAQYGSFNRTKYSSWVNNYNSSCTFLENNLSLCNIAVSGLINWTNSFNHINLIYLDSIHKLTEENFNTIHIDEFCRIQESYLTKVFHFMRDIYYRGAILIIKKNKALKRKDVPSEGKWTFKGFIPDIEEYEREFKDKNYGMNYEDQLRDFWSNINLDNLIDVRITTSNIGYVTYILKKRIDLAVSDYEEMSNEMKIKLNNCVTTYCNIFFRKLTEKALSDFNNFFEKYPSNSELYDKLSKENKINFAKDIVYDSEDDIKFQDLSFFYTSAYVEPLISIKTKYDVLYNLIKLEYNFEQIYEKILKVVDNICTLFNPLCTTHFLEFKKILPSQRENIVKEHSTKLNEFFNSDPNKNKSFLEEYYKTFCPNLILEEIESENYIKSYLNVMGSNELFVNDVKSKIYRKIKLQYSEIEECLKIFEPLRELITNNIDDTIKDFVQKVPPTPDYGSYMKYLKKIRRMKKYIDIIPKKIKYSMFAIDNREVINDLRNKLNANLTLLFKSLEDRITKIYETNNEKFNQFIKLIDVKLTTPEELVQIEKLKIQVNTNFLAALHDYEDSDKILMFLLKEDDVFPLEFSNKICDGIKKFYKFKFEQARIDKMHADNREVLENNFKKERAELEEEMASCHNEINLLDKQTHISDYVNVCAIIKYLQNKVNRLDERLNKSIKDEELLFDYKSEGFDEHNMSKRKLEKYGVLWENIEKFYEERKVLIHNFSEFIEIEHYVTFFNNVESEIKNNKKDLVKGEEVIGKLSKTVEDDIDSITNFLDIMQKVIESPAPLSDDLKKEVIEASENKRIEQSCREILFSYFSKKG
jgi:dynein heavy chain